jgi:hypothetical protein
MIQQFNRRETATGTYWRRVCVDLKAGLAPESAVVRLSLPPASAGLLRRLLTNLEHGGGMFIRNVRISLNYIAT